MGSSTRDAYIDDPTILCHSPAGPGKRMDKSDSTAYAVKMIDKVEAELGDIEREVRVLHGTLAGGRPPEH